jgi:CheY-like chemotaxis protein/two-component sensor histidine kinase
VIRLVEPVDSKLGWAADVTERQVTHLARLIDELLDVSRISQGKIALQTQALDLLEVIRQAVETIRPFIDSRRHQLILSLPQGPLWLRGDSARLLQVVSNLLHNAAKYTDNGGTIRLSLTTNNGQANLTVADNGIGIDSDLLPRVFDLFEQGDRSLDRSQGGLGVGLTLVRRLVELHNGSIEAVSAGTGLGSEFRVTLPCLTEVSNVVSREVSLITGDGSRTDGRRVLVVDDNIDAVQTATVFLELAGHEVKAVTDATQALAIAPVFLPDVIVLDIGLPGIDGFQLARKLRNTEQTKGALLIGVTGYGQDADRQRAFEVGFDHYLVKPADPSELAGLIGTYSVGQTTRPSSAAVNRVTR